jgi:hypothetical protein
MFSWLLKKLYPLAYSEGFHNGQRASVVEYAAGVEIGYDQGYEAGRAASLATAATKLDRLKPFTK